MNNFVYVISSVTLYFSCVNTLYKKLSKKQSLILLSYIFLIAFTILPYMRQMTTYITLTGILIIITYYSDRKILDLSCAIFGYIFCVALNQPLLIILQSVTHKSITELMSYENIVNTFSVMFCILCYVATKGIGYIFHKKMHIAAVLENQKLLISFLIMVVFYGFLFVFNISYGERIGYSYHAIAFNCILFLGTFFLTILMFCWIYKDIVKEQEDKGRLESYENLKIYAVELEKLYRSTQKFRHDCNNILLTLKDYITNGNLEALKKYFFENIVPYGEILSKNNIRLDEISKIQETAIKSIVGAKLAYAMELGLKTEVFILSPIKDFYIDVVDLSRVMGIYLDNAIEAAVLSKEKELYFCIMKKGKEVCIAIKNSSVPLEYSLLQLFEEGKSTKGETRGTGLQNVSDILKEYLNVSRELKYRPPYVEQWLYLNER